MIGCHHGMAWQFIREADHVHFRLPDGHTALVDSCQWRAAVVQFADDVKSFCALPRTYERGEAISLPSVGWQYHFALTLPFTT